MNTARGLGPASDPTSDRTPESPSSFRPDIQGLRALAVALVVLDHARIGPFHGGFIGVDVFFVISGFLITGLLLSEAQRRGRVSLLGFYARRARRILPAATLVLAVTAIASYFLLNGIQALQLLKDCVWAAFFAANVKFSRDETNYFAQDEAVSPIQHYWSLAVEEQFYLVWPLIVLVLVWLFKRRGRDRRAVVIAISVISLASFVWAVHLVGSDPRAAYFSTTARTWELGLGAAAAAAMVRVGKLPGRTLAALSWLGFGMIGFAALTYTTATRLPGAPALVPVVGAALLLGGGAGAAAWGPQRILGTAPMRWVGDRSYSFYLWHWPALVIVGSVWRTPHGWSGLLVAAAALAVSDLSYRFVENPFRTGKMFRPRWRGIALYPVSVGLLGVVVFTAHAGLVNHFNDPSPTISVSHYGQQPEDAPHHFSHDPQVALVQASVLAAQNQMSIPNPLKPAALGLADRVAADLGDCEYAGIPEPMPVCVRGDPDAERSMVLVGDSHMRHWIPVMDRLAKRYGYRAYFFVLQGCTPALVEPWSPITDAPDTGCVFFHEWSQEQIALIKPDIVMMSTDTQPGYVDAGGEHIEDNHEIASLIEQGMIDRIHAVEPYSKRIIVVGDVPRLEFDPSRISDRGATLLDGLSDPQPRSMLMRRAVKDAAGITGIDYIETKQWFCAYDKCPVVVGDYITHRDRGHMTLEYVSTLVEPMDRLLGLHHQK